MIVGPRLWKRCTRVLVRLCGADFENCCGTVCKIDDELLGFGGGEFFRLRFEREI